MVEYGYDAWGKCQTTVVDSNAANIAELNPFRYRGYYYDKEVGLYFLKTRYYDPEIGRFMTIDDLSYLDPETINGLNLYAYCADNPVMLIDENGCSPTWWQWLLSGLYLVAGIALCFVPGAQAFGVGLIVGGATSMASNIMSAAGVDGKTASFITNVLNIVGGIALCFTPFAAIGANMIGSGTLGIAGGFLSEHRGGSFEFGSAIGNIVGGIVGGHIYDKIRFSQIAKQGILIGKMDAFKKEATTRNLAYYDGLKGYKIFEKILGPTLASKLGWANNYHYIRNVMKFGGTIYNLGGPATGSYGKELALIAKHGYKLLVNLF